MTKAAGCVAASGPCHQCCSALLQWTALQYNVKLWRKSQSRKNASWLKIGDLRKKKQKMDQLFSFFHWTWVKVYLTHDGVENTIQKRKQNKKAGTTVMCLMIGLDNLTSRRGLIHIFMTTTKAWSPRWRQLHNVPRGSGESFSKFETKQKPRMMSKWCK